MGKYDLLPEKVILINKYHELAIQEAIANELAEANRLKRLELRILRDSQSSYTFSSRELKDQA